MSQTIFMLKSRDSKDGLTHTYTHAVGHVYSAEKCHVESNLRMESKYNSLSGVGAWRSEFSTDTPLPLKMI